MSDNANSNISLGFIYTLSSHYIPEIINGFKSNIDNQHINFSIKEGCTDRPCTADLVKSLKEGKLDIIFASLIPNDPEVEFIHICDQNLIALLPNNSPLANQPTVDLRDTESYSLIHYSGKSGLKQEINQLFEMVNIVPKVSCEVEDEPSMANFVSANMGIAIIPDNPSIRHYPIQVRPISYPSYTRKIYVGYMKNRRQTESIQSFIDYVLTSKMPFCKKKIEELAKTIKDKKLVLA
nr:LysR substrate-binding domain-containing protein [Bacillus sp. B15-48]